MPAMRRRLAFGALVALLIVAASAYLLADGRRPEQPAATATQAYMGTSGAIAARSIGRPDDGQWTMAAKNYASTRFAAAREIDTHNVDDLKVAFTFSTGIAKGHEAAQGVACCDVVNRGAAYADGRIFFNTLDNRTIALDAESGEELWDTQLGDINTGETMTMAPLVPNGKVLVGNSGGEMGVRGWLIALDAGSGETVWKAYATRPDEDVLIGEDYHPFYAIDRGHDLGVTSWPPEAWKKGGGNAWGWISYDPARRLVYYGTGNPGPI